jgi:hypothetical protein
MNTLENIVSMDNNILAKDTLDKQAVRILVNHSKIHHEKKRVRSKIV